MAGLPKLHFFLMLTFALFLISMIASGLLTHWSIGLARKRNLVAAVNERSSHKVPTPRVGGIGFFGALCVAFVAILWINLSDQGIPMTQVALIGGAVGAFILGLWDDRADPPAVAKLAIQLVLCAAPPLCGWRLGWIEASAGPLVSGAFTAAWIFLLMNVINFMDGINGIAGMFAISLGASLVAFGESENQHILGAALVGGAVGFLPFNFPRAQTFLGDCGSQPLGFITALATLDLGHSKDLAALPILMMVLPVSVFTFDVLLTLTRRSLRGVNILKAHREHLYQRHLIATGENHARTLAVVTGFQSIALLLLAVASALPWPVVAGAGVAGLFAYWMVVLAAERKAA